MLQRRLGYVALVLLVVGVLWLSGPKPAPQQMEPDDDFTPVPMGGEATLSNAAAPLTSAETPLKPLPANAVILQAAQAEIVAPFVVSNDPTAAGGKALALPQGTETKEHTGRAKLAFEVKTEGVYRTWARVRWTDDCGNSLDWCFDGAEPRTIGNDKAFEAWHWIAGEPRKLAPGPHALTLIEREDGVAVDQILFTTDEAYVPEGALTPQGEQPGIRRFGDEFARSPGHGLGAWEPKSGAWNLQFSFDPNRIPNQYALSGSASAPDQQPAVALAQAPDWDGARFAFSLFPETEGRCGAVLDHRGKGSLCVTFDTGNGKAKLRVEGDGIQAETDLGEDFRLKQWHAVAIERWAFVLRVWLDRKLVLSRFDLPAPGGAAGLYVGAGQAVFDDVAIDSIPYQTEGPGGARIPWKLGDDSRWSRPGSGAALLGRGGTLAAGMEGLGVEELVLDPDPQSPGACTVEAEGLYPVKEAGATLAWRPSNLDEARPSTVRLRAGEKEVRIKRAAVRFGDPLRDTYTVGPYDFNLSYLVDPSDYLDFTPEEEKQMRESKDAGKFLRRPRNMPVVGNRGGEHSPWYGVGGQWHPGRGVLGARGPGKLRHARDFVGDVELRAKVRLVEANATATLRLYDGGKDSEGARLRIESGKPGENEGNGLLRAEAGKWHEVCFSVRGSTATAQLDGGAARSWKIERGEAGGAYLEAGAGSVEFDDVAFVLPRAGPESSFFTFERRETDWWRTGQDAEWIDHGGIACVMASSWVSLVATKGDGMLWLKRPVPNDLIVALELEENSEWYGWDHPHSHTHYPYNNIRVALTPGGGIEKGYTLVLNAENFKRTVLYRDGKEVAQVLQDGRFPIRYVGGHAPMTPRKNRLVLVKRGGEIRAEVNGQTILTWSDPEPLSVSRVGLGGYQTRANFTFIELRSLSGAATPQAPAPSPEPKQTSDAGK
ncbi:MAG: hypothetical protein L6R28_22600 [Planctomycetes bacterium]|nr:hypothetical protein [Planctomycetota bacterium]